MTKSLILSCPTLQQELYTILEKYRNKSQVIFLPAALHREMQNIRPYVQNIPDNVTDVQQVILLISGCGGSTTGLIARSCPLVIPKTHDCLDILLSRYDNCQIRERDKSGIYMTGSWYHYHLQTALNAETLIRNLGYEKAKAKLQSVFTSFKKFYIIDTDCFDVSVVRQGLSSLVSILNGTIQTVKGKCGILHNIGTGQINSQNFYVIPAKTTVPRLKYRLEDPL